MAVVGAVGTVRRLSRDDDGGAGATEFGVSGSTPLQCLGTNFISTERDCPDKVLRTKGTSW
jgi:hypothetical protein